MTRSSRFAGLNLGNMSLKECHESCQGQPSCTAYQTPGKSWKKWMNCHFSTSTFGHFEPTDLMLEVYTKSYHVILRDSTCGKDGWHRRWLFPAHLPLCVLDEKDHWVERGPVPLQVCCWCVDHMIQLLSTSMVMFPFTSGICSAKVLAEHQALHRFFLLKLWPFFQRRAVALGDRSPIVSSNPCCCPVQRASDFVYFLPWNSFF